MTDATHTPGPWLLDGDKICTRRGNEIARITRYGAWLDVGTPYGLKNPIGDANARLIAAAPDLLAACEEMAAQLGGGNDYTKWEDAKAKLLVAIAKAQGA
jgi:hypothetical protein